MSTVTGIKGIWDTVMKTLLICHHASWTSCL